jgi:hypothetical protein
VVSTKTSHKDLAIEKCVGRFARRAPPGKGAEAEVAETPAKDEVEGKDGIATTDHAVSLPQTLVNEGRLRCRSKIWRIREAEAGAFEKEIAIRVRGKARSCVDQTVALNRFVEGGCKLSEPFLRELDRS